jgi:hypothetical protein
VCRNFADLTEPPLQTVEEDLVVVEVAIAVPLAKDEPKTAAIVVVVVVSRFQSTHA